MPARAPVGLPAVLRPDKPDLTDLAAALILEACRSL
jgi:hypothetical protein